MVGDGPRGAGDDFAASLGVGSEHAVVAHHDGVVARIYGGEGCWPTMRPAIEAIVAAHTCASNILELARHAPDYPDEVPPLEPHRLWPDFPHGVSIGGRSLIVYGRPVFPWLAFNIGFGAS